MAPGERLHGYISCEKDFAQWNSRAASVEARKAPWAPRAFTALKRESEENVA
jgi:hypothetical protein